MLAFAHPGAAAPTALPGGPWQDAAQPWPTAAPPELALAAKLAAQPALCVLPGCGAAFGPGRYGVVAIPARVEVLAAARGAVAAAVSGGRRSHDGRWRLVLLGYEMGAPEVYLPAAAPPAGEPAGLVMELDGLLLSDHATRTYRLLGTPHAALLAALGAPTEPPAPRPHPGVTLEAEVSDAEHRRRIGVVQAHIAAGDIYQANLSRPLVVAGELDPPGLLAALWHRNPVAHGAWIRAAGVELISNSMETLATYHPGSRTAGSMPIKGTQSGDGAGRARLTADPKERAEHVMIVDLVRNDLGRVCVAGSVAVPRLQEAVPFRGLWHGISTVRGTLAAPCDAGDLLAALFPGGSITGAPKRRAMEIIGELEARPRGFYTGSLVLVAPDGGCSASILIRTLTRSAGGLWRLAVGGGIVADSTPDREVRETWEKVAVFAEVMRGASPV